MGLSFHGLMKAFSLNKSSEQLKAERERKQAEIHPELAPCPTCDFIQTSCRCEKNHEI